MTLPPGSREYRTGIPASFNYSTTAVLTVVLPDPSGPSNVMNLPFCICKIITRDNPYCPLLMLCKR